MIMNNLNYFEYSNKNRDSIDEFIDTVGCLVITKNNQENSTQLMISVNQLNNLITTYATLKKMTCVEIKTVENVIDEIINILEDKTININYSPFCVYFQVVRYAYATYISNCKKMSLKEKRERISSLLDMYIENRLEMYNYHGYTHSILQVMSDSSSSRRNGITGIKMLEKSLEPLNFVHVNNITDFDNNNFCYLFSDKSEKKLFTSVINRNNIQFEFQRSRDNKFPDMIIKIVKDIFIIEHKLTNGGGGSQNAEINEIISFVNYSEKNSKVHYVSCLQGDFLQNLQGQSTQEKNISQRENIINALKNNKNNYFVNGKGLEKLFNDYIEMSEIKSVL